jgi:hypothetical protein
VYSKQPTAVPGSLDKKGGRKIPSRFHLCFIKDATVFSLFCLTNSGLALFMKRTERDLAQDSN